MLVAENAIPQLVSIMESYPQQNLDYVKQIFCFCLSHFLRVSENAIGILFCRFHLFLARSNLTPDTAVVAVFAAVALHNPRTKFAQSYTPPNFVDEIGKIKTIKKGSWWQDNAQNQKLPFPQSRKNNRYPKNAAAVRSFLADYFYRPDQVPWQCNVLV